MQLIKGMAMKQVITSPKALGQLIKRVRKSNNYSQHNIGANFAIDQTTVSSIENGAPGTRLTTILRLLAVLNLELVIQDKHETNSDTKVDW